jgi:hypothetical protein
MKGEILKINDVRSIQAEAEWELLARIGVRACLVIPLFSKDTFYGFIGLECYKGPKLWVSEDTLVLQTAAEIMMRCIEKWNSQEEHIDKLRAGIEQLSSLLKTKSSFIYQCLTPMEIQLANLIKQGKGNNQIADLMNLSRRTVKVHRYNIRKKLQLDKKRVNLNTYLLTME